MEAASIIDALVKLWPVISGVAILLVGAFIFIWKIHTRAKINERVMLQHQKDDKEIHAALTKIVDNTYRLIDGLNNRFDDVLTKVHDTHMDVSESINKQSADIQILDSRVDELGSQVSQLKKTIENGHSKSKN